MSMTTVGVLRETAGRERRVALTPDGVARLRRGGEFRVLVDRALVTWRNGVPHGLERHRGSEAVLLPADHAKIVHEEALAGR